jgi:hypothetical protein
VVKHRRTRQQLLAAITIAAAGLAFSSNVAAERAEPSRPDFVLIIGDDISVDDFGCYGHPHIRTPNVDRLAAEGLRFTNAYLTTGQCSPTRCSLITGRYPHNTGAPELHTGLPEGQIMFPAILKQAGYHTAAAGKWHLGTYAKSAFEKIAGGGPKWIRYSSHGRRKSSSTFARILIRSTTAVGIPRTAKRWNACGRSWIGGSVARATRCPHWTRPPLTGTTAEPASPFTVAVAGRWEASFRARKPEPRRSTIPARAERAVAFNRVPFTRTRPASHGRRQGFEVWSGHCRPVCVLDW